MKMLFLFTAVFLLLTASIASAASPGLDMGWTNNATNGCPASGTSIQDMTDLCNDNFAGPYTFALSFNAPANITKFVGEELIIDVTTEVSPLPDWWHLEAANAGQGIPAGCRDGSWAFSTVRGLGNTALCKDYWGTSPQSGGFVWLPGDHGRPQLARFFGAYARATSSAIAITQGVNYYVGSGNMDVNHAVADVGVALCNGCTLGACIVFQYMKVAQPAGTPGGDALVTDFHNRQFMTWQGGVNTNCPTSTPTRRASWGQVKSLYR